MGGALNAANDERRMRHPDEEARELRIDLVTYRTNAKPGSGYEWVPIASWPAQREAYSRWLAADSDYPDEPTTAHEYVGFGPYVSDAA
jgi:hypothetical protein